MKMKRIGSLLLVVTLMFCNGLNALADETSAPPSNQISRDPNFSSDSISFPVGMDSDGIMLTGEDGLQFIYIKSSISKGSSSSVIVSATSTANLICMNIGGTVRVQRWINNEWTTYYTFIAWGHGVSTYTTTKTVSVEPGYYYRVTANHTAITEQSGKYGTTTAKSIYIN